MQKYCICCDKEVETKIISRNESFAVLNENIEVEANVLICEECGEALFCEELDEATLKMFMINIEKNMGYFYQMKFLIFVNSMD